MKKYLSIIVSALLLLSCEKEIQIDIPGFKEQLVIDGSIETGQPPIVLLSRSKNLYSPTDLNAFLGSFVSGAIVSVSDGVNTVQLDEICSDNLPPGTEALAAELFGVSVEDLANFHLCAYTTFDPSFFGQVGKTYTLTVTFEGKTYTASTQIVTPTPLNSVYWKPEPDKPNHGFSYAWLSDPANQFDGYRWEVKRLNKDANGNPKDMFFEKTFNPFFNDDFFDGLTFEFWYENPMSFDDETIEDEYKGYYQLGDTVVIKLSKIDQQVYEFMEKKYAQLNTGGSPFASPSNIPTNISGGALGVWAGYAPSYDTLICVP